jgi:PKD repeat protein
LDSLDLPIYAHLQDAAGRDYVLTLASLSRLEQAGVSYRILDSDARGVTYIIALERRPGARQQATQQISVLYDDGRYVVARDAPGVADALAELGFDVQRLDDAPLVLRQPAVSLAPEAFAYDPIVAEMIAQVQQSTVYTYDGQLSGEWPVIVGGAPYTISTRHTNSGTPIQNATQYVYEHMQALGLGVSYHNWTGGSYSNRNVIGVLTGTTRPGEIVLVTAHLDDMPSSGRAPGADDNASGSVGVLVAADILSQYRFERTVRFVFFTGEEQGLYGSQAYATLVYNAGENIVAVYNMDMIAWDSTGGPTLRLHSRTTGNPGYPGDLAIAGVFTNVVNAYGLSGNLTPILDPDGITASDHSSFWNRGYSAILAIEDDVSDFNAYYHTINDRLQYLNMTYFTNYVRASVGTAAHLAYPAQRGYLKGIIYDGAQGGGLVGASVEARSGPDSSFTTTSITGGLYSMSVPSGTYTVTATALGYMSFITTSISVTTDQTTTLDITLEVTPTFVITGYVRDALTHQPVSATLSVPGSTFSATQTNPATGWYSLSLPVGNHTLQAEALNYSSSARAITVTFSQQQDFDLQPLCLLVVDDDGGASWDTFYTTALSRLGYTYRRVTQSPDLATLAFYQGVIWLTGNQSADTLTGSDQSNLAAYLDGQGRLFVSGQDIGMDIGGSSFYHDYLQASFHADDTNAYTLTGLNVMSGLDITIQGGDGANNQFYPDDVTLLGGGAGVFKYPDPHLYGGVAYSGTYRTMYLSFGYEAINSQVQRDAVMSATLNYLGVCGAPQAPQAGFVTHSPVALGEMARFTNTTGGTAWITYTWSFGDGSPVSYAVHPTHVYTQARSYEVMLTAQSRYGASVYSDTVIVQVQPVTLTVNVVGQGTVDRVPPGPYLYGDVVTLTATPTVGWSFSGWSGDQVGATNPVVITLDSSKTITATFAPCISISGLDFTFAPSAPQVGDTVTFTGAVAAGTMPITYTWDLGDGGMGSGSVITHSFPITVTRRAYTVTLTAANACTSQATASQVVMVPPYYTYLPIVLR